jgi:hypothetical protein
MSIPYLLDLEGRVLVPAVRDGMLLRVSCPYCGREHAHGAAVYGHRLAHCADLDIRKSDAPLKAAQRRGYVLMAA